MKVGFVTDSRGRNPTIECDPESRKPYVWKLHDYLGSSGDTIATYEFIVSDSESAATAEDATLDNDDTWVVAWVAPNDSTPRKFSVTCRFMTVAGIEDDRTLHFRVIDH